MQVRHFGSPDLFITMTANPKWKEISGYISFQQKVVTILKLNNAECSHHCTMDIVSDSLLPGQTAAERPDLVSRVFNLKFRGFCKDVFKDGLLGNAIAHVFVVEFQKRGLPHAHVLVTFDKVSAEIKKT